MAGDKRYTGGTNRTIKAIIEHYFDQVYQEGDSALPDYQIDTDPEDSDDRVFHQGHRLQTESNDTTCTTPKASLEQKAIKKFLKKPRTFSFRKK